MKNMKPKLVIGIIFMAATIGFLVKSALNTRAGLPETTIEQLVDGDAAARLDAANIFLSPSTDELRAQIPADLAQAIHWDQDIQHRQELIELFQQRLTILMNPDLDGYIAHIAALTGQSTTQVRAGLSDRFIERWDTDTRIFKEASFATDQCILTTGDSANAQSGGTVIAKRDPGVYQTARLLADPNTPRAEIQVPIMIAVTMNGQGHTLVLELVMGFVWNESRNTWIPHVVAFRDPTSLEERLPVPWI